MKAALKTAEGRFEIDDVDEPVLLARNWVKARVRVAGICGTDLRHWEKHDKHLACKIMGHEMAGEVVEVGTDVTHLKIGDRVVIETVLGDEICEWCRAQQYNLCPHLYDVRMKTVSQAFAEYVSGPWHKFYKLPDNVSFAEAAVLDTFAVCLHAIQRTGIHLGDKAAVIGAGPIGLGQVQLAKLSGADVILTDPHDHSLEVGKRLGTSVAVNSDAGDFREKVLDFTCGRGADVTFECAGGKSMPKTLPLAISCTRIGGKVGLVGGFDEGEVSIPLEWQRMQMAEIQLVPCASYALWDIRKEMQMCLDLVATGKLDAKSLITHHVSLDEINRGFEIAADKEANRSIFVAIEI